MPDPSTSAACLALFVVNGKRKPVDTDRTIDATKQLPATVEHAGATYHFASADLVERTATYIDVPLAWH